jgi:hypothetical protein
VETGWIHSCFHWDGTIEVDSDELNNLASGLANTGAASLRYHAGTRSSLVAVGRSRSYTLNTCHSVMTSSVFAAAISLGAGL